MILRSFVELIERPTPELPVVIPTFNNYTYLKNMVNFFSARGFDVIVLDNGSTYEPMVKYLEELSQIYYVLVQPGNPGPRDFYFNKAIYNWLPQYFFATDPDLEFDRKMDRESMLHLVELSEIHGAFKIGSALRIDMIFPNVLDDVMNYNGSRITIRGIEQGYYNSPIASTQTGDTIYIAAIDTTFALHNKKFHTEFMAANLRVDGRYAAIHYGWMRTPPMPAEEYEFYKESIKPYPYASTEILRSGQNYAY